MNGGTVQLGVPGVTPPDTALTVASNYVGMGGTVAPNTFLGGDGSPSDKLIIAGGYASGTTSLHITNAGGPGALTNTNGIQVVQAINDATTTADAFRLGNPELRAGASEYRLFQGDLNGSDPSDGSCARHSFPRGDGNAPEPIIGPEHATYGVVLPRQRPDHARHAA